MSENTERSYLMKFNFYIILLIITFKLKYAETPAYINHWVTWNIGQGQWVTHILSDKCLHYDVGGEFGRFKIIKKTLIHHCGNKINKINLSHWDYDHFFNIPMLAKIAPHLCWQNIPEFAHTKKSAKSVLELKIPNCREEDKNLVTWSPLIARNTNESSTIFYDETVLMSGDSPIQKEKIWATEIDNIGLVRILILGHHGSRTSTGKDLLSHLPHLKLSIASARYLKYKHPHKDTLARLSEFDIPVLKTEDWGNIWFE